MSVSVVGAPPTPSPLLFGSSPRISRTAVPKLIHRPAEPFACRERVRGRTRPVSRPEEETIRGTDAPQEKGRQPRAVRARSLTLRAEDFGGLNSRPSWL